MLKESHEQPRAIANTLQERVANGRLLEAAFGPAATEVFKRTQNVHIVACGTSYHAAAVARYFIEQICKVPCAVDIASEYRYRSPSVPPNSLFVRTISQSGETADTLALALRLAKESGYLSSMAICNVPESFPGARVGAGYVDPRRSGNRASPRPRLSRPNSRPCRCSSLRSRNITAQMPSANGVW